MKHPVKAAVIGSGVAGLATAIRLAVQGLDVTVYEKNEYAGGKMGAFEKAGFHFDTGPSLFVQPGNLEDLFSIAGEDMRDYLPYAHVPVACKYFYEDGTVLQAVSDVESFATELSSKTGERATNVMGYLGRSKTAYNEVGSLFLDEPFSKRMFFKSRFWKAITGIRWQYLFQSLDKVNANSFEKPQVVQLFNRYATYNGSDPFQAPGMFCIIPHAEFNEGVFFPSGGMAGITRALVRLAEKKGVRFHFNAAVQRIIYHDGRVRGVVVDNQNIAADVVVSNADLYVTCRNLLQDPVRSAKEIRRERSSSAVVFYWGMNREFPELELHNIFFSNNYKAEFEDIFRYGRIYSDPTVYVNITSKCETGLAPEGKENWFVMVNAPSNAGQDWINIKRACRERVIKKLSRLLKTELEPLIIMEESLDPLSVEATSGAYKGAIYGSSSNSWRNAFFRQPNADRRIGGLYFAGGTVHPGGGIPLCLKSAAIVSKSVERDLQHLRQHG